MAQSVALHPVPVELELELDPESDHYYGFDQSSASALASQHSDTLGASASDPPSDLGPPGPPAALEPKSLTSATDTDTAIATAIATGHGDHHQEEDYGYETESDYVRHYDDDDDQQQHEEEVDEDHPHHHHHQSQQPSESPSWQAGSQLPSEHEAHQGQGQQPSQPYRPESGPVHASATTSPPLPHHQPASVHNPRSNRSYSVAASLASVGSQSSIRRKPLSPTASPLAVRFSSKLNGNHMPLYDLQHPDSGYYSLDSPDLYDLSPNKQEHAHAPISAPVSVPVPAAAAAAATANNPSPPGQTPSLSPPLVEESDEDDFAYNWPSPPRGPPRAAGPHTRNSIPDANPVPGSPQTGASRQSAPSVPLTGPNVTALAATSDSNQIDVGIPGPAVAANSSNTSSSIMSMFGRKSIPQHLDLDRPNSDIQQASLTTDRPPDSATSTSSSLNKPLPKSPPISPVRSPLGSSKLSSFFGWGQPSPTTTEEIHIDNDDHPHNNNNNKEEYSPIPSPTEERRDLLDESTEERQEPIPVQQHAHKGSALGYLEAYFPTPPNSYTQVSPVVEIEEMEDELKAISAELASSIRREMDLEDLVERLQAEVSNPQAPGKRTSDYFSDSGYSSAKYSDYDQSKEEIAQITRRAEQEKAQLRLELTNKLQDERGRRNALDQQIKALAEKASQADAAQMTSKDADARVKELERTCEDLRRRLSEEKQVKDNFEDLLSALKGELQSAALERDNLRDEVVPQLKSRVEGLEAQQAENEKLAYDTTRLQQEIQTLKEAKVRNESVARLRSSSVTGKDFRLSRPPSVKGNVGLSRSNTVKSGHVESRDVLAERLKDVEAQRDALHNALKNLLDRQDFQNKENEKKIKSLEVERDRLLSASPRKVGFEREVSTLRDEVNTLRRRAEEAIEQKWQVEKGLIGLKSDLDRAEEEITSLRDLLKAKDILIPDSFSRYSSGGKAGVVATSSSLEKAYKDLQNSYQEALKRITNMDLGGTSASQDEKTRIALKRLEQSLSAAMLERDDARLEAASLQEQVMSLEESEKAHLASENDLADQLRDSANRVEELTQQVRAQLAINTSLRTRLSDAIARGETTQKANKERLATMQTRMKTLEDQIIEAQTAAEERVNRHEEELASLREANNGNLQRRTDSNGGLRSPRLFPPKSPMTPLLSPNGGTFPRMRSSGSRPSSRARPSTAEREEEDNESVDVLKARIAELEKALVTADFEMQEVVNRMNTAQIDVMMLQEERETAARETKRLQQALEAEQVKAFNERFQTIKDY